MILIIEESYDKNVKNIWMWFTHFLNYISIHHFVGRWSKKVSTKYKENKYFPYTSTVPKRVPIIFWRFGSLFIFQVPYFQCLGFLHAKNVNSVCMCSYNN